MTTKIFLLVLVTTLLVRGEVPCGLRWQTIGTSFNLENEIAVHLDQLYIAKIVRNGSHMIGNYNRDTFEAFFDTEDEVSSIMFLSNPYKCSVRFVDSYGWEERKSFLVRTGNPDREEFIGRGFFNQGSLHGKWGTGGVTLSNGKLQRVNHNTLAKSSTPIFSSRGLQLLESTSFGLTLEISHYEIDTSSSTDQADVSGIELIENNSAATIAQTVTHSKNVTEITRTTVTKKYVAVRTTTKKTKILFRTKTKTTTERWTDETTEVTEIRESITITVTKRISIPPYESIEACSTIIIQEETEVPYTALGTYTAPGLTGEQVLEVLREDGINEGRVVGDTVQLRVDGFFTYKLALSTQFRTNPLGMEGGCVDKQKKSAR